MKPRKVLLLLIAMGVLIVVGITPTLADTTIKATVYNDIVQPQWQVCETGEDVDYGCDHNNICKDDYSGVEYYALVRITTPWTECCTEDKQFCVKEYDFRKAKSEVIGCCISDFP